MRFGRKISSDYLLIVGREGGYFLPVQRHIYTSLTQFNVQPNGPESVLTSHQYFSDARNFPDFMKPRFELPCLQHLSLVHISREISPVRNLQSHLFKNYFNIIFPSTSTYSVCCVSFWLRHQNPVYVSLLPYMWSCCFYLIFALPNIIQYNRI